MDRERADGRTRKVPGKVRRGGGGGENQRERGFERVQLIHRLQGIFEWVTGD